MVETCDTSGILNSAVNLVASIAATEAMKLIVGARDQFAARLLSYDVWTNDYAEVCREPSARGAAPASSTTSSTSPEKAARTSRCADATRCRSTSASGPSTSHEITRRLTPHGTVKHNEFVLKFWHDPYEMTLFPDGRAIIKGTTDTAIARSLYARYVGTICVPTHLNLGR